MREWDSVWQGINQAVAVSRDKIVWVGETVPEGLDPTIPIHHYRNKYLSPGLIDPHTHAVYAGERSSEFMKRLQGLSYAEIAKQGGGIRSTVRATREASSELLYTRAKERLLSMMRQGVTTVEIKSGYGLDLETEIKMLKVAKQLERDLPLTVVTTYLGAHTVPEDYENRPDHYIDFICDEVLPRIHEEQLATHVDVFCESIGFDLTQTQKVLEKALSLGFQVKCHAEQLSLMGATKWAASKGALSCDHLEYIDEQSIIMMAQNKTTAVLLPGAYYFLKETQKPPIDLFRKYGVRMAIATDCNPGSSPTTSLPLMMNMACVLYDFTIDEAWSAVTEHAASALGLGDRGALRVGQKADFCLWPFEAKSTLCYTMGGEFNPIRVYHGQVYAT